MYELIKRNGELLLTNVTDKATPEGELTDMGVLVVQDVRAMEPTRTELQVYRDATNRYFVTDEEIKMVFGEWVDEDDEWVDDLE